MRPPDKKGNQECYSEFCTQIERISPTWVGNIILISFSSIFMFVGVVSPELIGLPGADPPLEICGVLINVLCFSMVFCILRTMPVFERICVTDTKVLVEHRFIFPKRTRFKTIKLTDIKRIQVTSNVWFLTIFFKRENKNRKFKTFTYHKRGLVPFVEEISRKVRVETE